MDSKIHEIDAKIQYLKILVEVRKHPQFVKDLVDIIGSSATYDPHVAIFKEGQRSVINWLLSNHNVSIKTLEEEKLKAIDKKNRADAKLNLAPDLDANDPGVPLRGLSDA